MVHLRPLREDLAKTTVCGFALNGPIATLPICNATDDPWPGNTADDRCPDCWKVWRALNADGFDWKTRN